MSCVGWVALREKQESLLCHVKQRVPLVRAIVFFFYVINKYA